MDNILKNIPTKEAILSNKWLKWLSPFLSNNDLWSFNKRSIALGASIGIFFGLIIPFAQIVFSVILSVILRANIPVAAFSTFITNPFTFAPIYYIAYQLGSFILNTPPIEFKMEDIDMVLKPLFTGLFSLALILSLLSYILVIIFFKIKAYIRLNRKNKKTFDK
jgi:uncharacterized protein (DUF2062 family)